MSPILTRPAHSEGVFGHFPFITAPRRPPTAEEAQINQSSNYVWPDLNFDRLRTGGESVHVNVDHIAEGTLFPFGGHLCTHWEYLAAAASEPASVSTWIRIEDPDRDGRPLWYIPEAENPLILPLHLSVGEACGSTANKLNLEIVWSVFAPEDQFGTSSRFVYRSTRQLNHGTRLWGPPRRGFYAANMWGRESNKAAAAIKAAFLRGEEDPDNDLDLQRRCIGDPGRDERIYGVYKETTVASHSVPALPASCVLAVSVSQPAIVEGSFVPASGEDLVATFLLPLEYHGVLVQPDPGRNLLSLKAAFMDPSFEPVASSEPPRASLAKWWQAVAKRVRDPFDKKTIPEDLKTALKGRSRLYSSAVGEASDVVDLAAEAPVVDHVAEAPAPAKRSRRSVFRPRVVATSSSSSSQGEPDAGRSRRVLSQPRSGEDGGRGSGTALGGANSASGLVGALNGFTAEELGLLRPLLQRLLERL